MNIEMFRLFNSTIPEGIPHRLRERFAFGVRGLGQNLDGAKLPGQHWSLETRHRRARADEKNLGEYQALFVEEQFLLGILGPGPAFDKIRWIP